MLHFPHLKIIFVKIKSDHSMDTSAWHLARTQRKKKKREKYKTKVVRVNVLLKEARRPVVKQPGMITGNLKVRINNISNFIHVERA